MPRSRAEKSGWLISPVTWETLTLFQEVKGCSTPLGPKSMPSIRRVDMHFLKGKQVRRWESILLGWPVWMLWIRVYVSSHDKWFEKDLAGRGCLKLDWKEEGENEGGGGQAGLFERVPVLISLQLYCFETMLSKAAVWLCSSTPPSKPELANPITSL